MRLAALKGWLGGERASPAAGEVAHIALEAIRRDDAPSPVARRASDDPPRRGRHWIEIADILWGEGFQIPGGAAEVLRLANPLGLTDAASVLLLGAGTGGPLLEIAAETGAWVSGYEADAELAEAAARRLQQSARRRARHATVAPLARTLPEFRHHAFNHVILLDALRGDRMQDLLGPLMPSLKPGGQLVMVQTVADSALDPDDKVVAAWRRLGRRDDAVPVAAELTRGLQRLGFDVRVVEDLTERHVRLILSGWSRLVGAMEGARPESGRAAAIVEAAELWMRRIRLLQTGQLRFARWHALGPVGAAAHL